MRTIRYILLSVIILGIITAAGFFAARETLMSWGTDAMRDALRELAKSSRGGAHESVCAARAGDSGAVSSGQVVVQLRFTSSDEYVMEAICPQFAFDPILISQNTLPDYVDRIPGSSGMIYSDEGRTGVVLEVFGELERSASDFLKRDLSWLSKREAVFLTAGKVEVVSASAALDLGTGPVTSCSGYGYACCQATAEKGSGEQIFGLTDCPQSCYSQCIARPIVLAFNPNPFFDNSVARIVRVQANTAVEFSVVSDALADSGVRALFDFGDGKTAESSDLSIPTIHTYSCATTNCQYTAKVQLVDVNGIESAETSITQITIMVE